MKSSLLSSRNQPSRRPHTLAGIVIALATTGVLAGCSSWSTSASPGKQKGWFLWDKENRSLRAKVEADSFPTAAEAGL